MNSSHSFRKKRSVSWKGKYPTDAFRQAILCGNVQTAEKLLNLGKVNPNILILGKRTSLHYVAEQGMYEMAEMLLANKKTKVDAVSLHGYTPLMVASQIGNIPMMKLLLEHAAQKSKQDFHGRTILHWTVLQRNFHATHFLLRNRTDPNVMDIYGQTPLYLAATVICSLSITRLLLKCKADPLINVCPNFNVFFELCLVANNKTYESILRYMLKYIPNVNVIDGNFRKQCALHMVAISNYLPVAKILLDRGANRLHKDTNGRTPYDLAQLQTNKEIAYFLYHYEVPG